MKINETSAQGSALKAQRALEREFKAQRSDSRLSAQIQGSAIDFHRFLVIFIDFGQVLVDGQKTMVSQHLETMSHVGGWVKARFGRFWLCWALLRGVSGTSLRILGNPGISLVCSKSMKINETQ